MATSLPTNIDTSNADDGTRPTVKTHQQHHDTIHAEVNRLTLGQPVWVGTVAPADNTMLWVDIN